MIHTLKVYFSLCFCNRPRLYHLENKQIWIWLEMRWLNAN